MASSANPPEVPFGGFNFSNFPRYVLEIEVPE